MSVCFWNLLANGKYSNFLIVAGFSNSLFSGKSYLRVKNSYLPTCLDEKAEN